MSDCMGPIAELLHKILVIEIDRKMASRTDRNLQDNLILIKDGIGPILCH